MNKVLDILKEIRPDSNFESSNNFLDDALLDSLDLIRLVSELDDNYSISISGDEFIPENFINFASIEALVAKYQKESNVKF